MLEALVTPSTADSKIPIFLTMLLSDSTITCASTQFGASGGSHCFEQNRSPKSVGTELNPLVEPTSRNHQSYRLCCPLVVLRLHPLHKLLLATDVKIVVEAEGPNAIEDEAGAEEDNEGGRVKDVDKDDEDWGRSVGRAVHVRVSEILEGFRPARVRVLSKEEGMI